NAKVRASMTTVSGFFQSVRMLAIKNNGSMTARYFNRPVMPFSLVYYAKAAADTSTTPTTSDSQAELEAPITAYNTPTGTGAPPAITNTALGLSADPQTGDPSFNSRGLPCAYSFGSGSCLNAAFIKYFRDNRIGSSGGWAAISVTPAGR